MATYCMYSVFDIMRLRLVRAQVPQWQRHRPIGSPHKETVQHIDILQNPKRYITISRVRFEV